MIDKWFYGIAGLVILFYLFLISRPEYWTYKTQQVKANQEMWKAILARKESFRGGGGEAIGGRTAGPSNLGDLEEDFRGGGGEAIGGRTAGPSNLGDLEEEFSEQQNKNTRQIQEAFSNIGASQVVSGKPETEYIDGPAPASLKEPRKPYNLLEQLPPAPRGSISCLTAACCAETDFEWRTNLTGNFLQRTNNYKREFPDSCTAPLTELNLAFYKNSVLPKVA
jgi:hypothetical protein